MLTLVADYKQQHTEPPQAALESAPPATARSPAFRRLRGVVRRRAGSTRLPTADARLGTLSRPEPARLRRPTRQHRLMGGLASILTKDQRSCRKSSPNQANSCR